jgi:diguanylate cyclase (GGDEF)-like protein
MDIGKFGAPGAVRQTLLDQMRITDYEIRQRKELFGINMQTEEMLFGLFPLVKRDLESIIVEFYDQQTEIDEIALLIGDSDTLAKLQAGMRGYVMELFSGCYDISYVNSRLRIGLVHKRIGVSPKLYLAAVRVLRRTLGNYIRQANADSEENISEELSALSKILSFDVSYIMDTYIRSLMLEVKSRQQELSDYAASLEEKIRERTRELEAVSRTDSLTELNNQRAFQDHLRIAMANASRTREALCLVYMDLDNFKTVNNEKGHQEGDHVLACVGDAIRSSVREMDIGCRYGGDEFCLILPRATLEQATVVCKRVQERFAGAVAGVAPQVLLSIGIAQAGPEHFPDGSDLIKLADKLMYEAKRGGQGQINSQKIELAPVLNNGTAAAKPRLVSASGSKNDAS